ncbi:MAG TPA: penicillin-binding protein activator [Rhodopila sp.]|uniref:penicillin-binding protein activator n=1 Tax=Rhodopila sp. TaxID=2480087 RepID=UPI002CC657D3|nr:penicillin-binding protein activator [Rhodopila sp.]HVY13718.1 penicillin-binding protein activator [Rhodopila sp.]
MGRWASVFLIWVLALASCSSENPNFRYGYQSSSTRPTVLGANGGPGSGQSARHIAILLPLTGPHAGVGAILLQAAQLAFQGEAGSSLDVLDTAGTPSGAANAVSAAVSHGDGVILGPLTSAETAQVAPAAQSAGIPVLAFTNDATQARPGVWPLGISPGQQVRRLVAAVQAQGHTQLAALLPDTDFGHVMASALQDALQSNGLPNAQIRMHAAGMSSITAAIRDLSDYAGRRGPIDARIKSLKNEGTAEARRQIADLQRSRIPPPPFDALLLADTGDALQEIAAVLPYYDVDRGAVQILGPSLWADRASGSGAVPGAWYAAPDSTIRASFVRDYQDRYGAAPPQIADVAYDAALIGRYASTSSGSLLTALTQPSGFIGSDGLVVLTADGRVRRGLAVFKVGGTMIAPPPDSSAPNGAGL